MFQSLSDSLVKMAQAAAPKKPSGTRSWRPLGGGVISVGPGRKLNDYLPNGLPKQGYEGSPLTAMTNAQVGDYFKKNPAHANPLFIPGYEETPQVAAAQTPAPAPAQQVAEPQTPAAPQTPAPAPAQQVAAAPAPAQPVAEPQTPAAPQTQAPAQQAAAPQTPAAAPTPQPDTASTSGVQAAAAASEAATALAGTVPAEDIEVEPSTLEDLTLDQATAQGLGASLYTPLPPPEPSATPELKRYQQDLLAARDSNLPLAQRRAAAERVARVSPIETAPSFSSTLAEQAGDTLLAVPRAGAAVGAALAPSTHALPPVGLLRARKAHEAA